MLSENEEETRTFNVWEELINRIFLVSKVSKHEGSCPK